MPVTEARLTAAINSVGDANTKTALSTAVGAMDGTLQTSIANAIDLGADALSPARHSVMLAHLALGMKVLSNVASLKAVVGAWSASDCDKELDAVRRSYAERVAEIAKSKGASYFGSVVLGPSFYRYASSEEQRVARLAIKTSQEMALKAVIAVATVRANATAEVKKRFEDHFGAYDALRFRKVKGNIDKIYRALTGKPVLLYYRGAKAAGIDDSADSTGAASSTTSVAETWTDTQLTNIASLHSYKNEAKCSAVTHIWMGSAAFTTGASGPKSTGGKRAVSGDMSIAGTILHEISHYACSTADEGDAVCSWGSSDKCYGRANVEALAAADVVKACNNADSYRYYFESFQ
ncbi:MAG: M35 family metallo-endopeptidase [Rubrivivax sp.]